MFVSNSAACAIILDARSRRVHQLWARSDIRFRHRQASSPPTNTQKNYPHATQPDPTLATTYSTSCPVCIHILNPHHETDTTQNITTPSSASRSNKSGGDNGTPMGGRRTTSSERRGRRYQGKGGKQGGEPVPPPLRAPPPEGCGEPRPLLYGGGDEAAAIVSRWGGYDFRKEREKKTS